MGKFNSFGAKIALLFVLTQSSFLLNVFAVDVVAPCRGDGDERPEQKAWRKCSDLMGGKADSFDSSKLAQGLKLDTKSAGRGVRQNLHSKMQNHIDHLYTGPAGKPTRCDVTGSPFTHGPELLQGKSGSCGQPVSVDISPSDFSIILGLGAPHGTLEASYFYGMLPQLNACFYKKTQAALSDTSKPPVVSVSGSCAGPANDYNSHRAHFESVYVRGKEAYSSCPDRELLDVDTQGQGNNFGNNVQACLQVQAARQLLESAFETLLTCNTFERADQEYRKLLGSPNEQTDVIKKNTAEVQGQCDQRCSPIMNGFDPITDDVGELVTELQDCANECYSDLGIPSLVEIIKAKTANACKSGISWSTLLSVLSLAFRPRSRRNRKFLRFGTLAMVAISLSLGSGGCSKKKNEPPKSSGTPEAPAPAAPEAADISGDLAALQGKIDALETKFGDIETYIKGGGGGTSLSPVPTQTVVVTVTPGPTQTTTSTPPPVIISP